jgi:hypothetical protein
MGQRLCQDCKARAVHTIVEPSRLHPQAVPCLVVGIIAAVFGCAAPVISPIALYLGSKVLHDMPARPHPSSRTVALAGMVAAGGTLGLWLVAAVAALLFRGGGR